MSNRLALCAAFACLSALSACGPSRLHVSSFENWTRVDGADTDGTIPPPVPKKKGTDSTDAQAAAALCWHDRFGDLRPDHQGEDSWPTRARLEACMRRQGFSLVPVPLQHPKVVD